MKATEQHFPVVIQVGHYTFLLAAVFTSLSLSFSRSLSFSLSLSFSFFAGGDASDAVFRTSFSFGLSYILCKK